MGDASFEKLRWSEGILNLACRAEESIQGPAVRKQTETSESAIAHDDPEENKADNNDEECDGCDGESKKRDGKIRTGIRETVAILALDES